MELIRYLTENFLTREQLLEFANIQENELLDLQARRLMPQASYTVKMNLTCDSFFGEHSDSSTTEYFAKGYIAWLERVTALNDPNRVYSEFSRRYESTIKELFSFGHLPTHPKLHADLQKHITEEWDYFLQGVYGLCTKSGLPEDIAAKEFAITTINELTVSDELNESELRTLTWAVNLLDNASSQFAPHERLKSSRHRLVDEMRRRYRLQCS